jgi:hypothetical protein
MTRQQKITFGEIRASGASRIIVHCGDYKCGHSVTTYPARVNAHAHGCQIPQLMGHPMPHLMPQLMAQLIPQLLDYRLLG